MATDSEWLVANFTQATLFGLYIITLLHCLRWLLYQDEGWKLRCDRNMRWLMLVTALILFVFATVNLGISIHMTLLVMYGGTVDQFYFDKLNIVNTVIENSTYLITDAVLVYRCWVVHRNSWRIISLPIFLWFSCVTASILILFYEFGGFPNSSTASGAKQSKYRTDVAFYVCHIANNIYTTSAIVYRILQVVNNTVGGGLGGSRRLYKTGRIIAESGILYVASSVLLLVAYIGASRSIPFFILVSPIFDAVNYSMSMISFNLVIIRVNQQRAEADTLLGPGLSNEKSLLELGSRSYADSASQDPMHQFGSSEQHEESTMFPRISNEFNNGTKS